ncbi:MAG TPA: VWA domain-containing protein [bacterium]|nr:VWA domain-containing protein [bacterium]HPN31823.1 VWA domain-containing protein [bacterium]
MWISEFKSGYYLYLIPLTLIVFFLFRKKIFFNNAPPITFSDIRFFKKQPCKLKTNLRTPVLLILRAAALILIIIAAAGPRAGTEFSEQNIFATDIMILIDSSASMQAEDFSPENRLEAAKRTAQNFINSRKSDRIGIIEFAAGAFLRCPLTQDYQTLRKIVDQIVFYYDWEKDEDDARKVPVKFHNGTFISSALGIAGHYLKKSSAKSRIIILVTDGRQEGDYFDPITIAAALKEYGIKIYTVQIGMADKGVKFPVFYKNKGKQYHYNSDGSLPVIEVDEELLQTISRNTSGKYYKTTDFKTLKQAFADIDELEKTNIKIKKYVEYEEYFQWFALAAIILLIVEVILKNTVFKMINDL